MEKNRQSNFTVFQSDQYYSVAFQDILQNDNQLKYRLEFPKEAKIFSLN